MENASVEITPREKLAEAMRQLGLTVSAEFVPFSVSRNAKESHRSLNWRVTLERNGKPILTTDYGAGIANCPSYKRLKMLWRHDGMTREQSDAIEFETERGRAAPRFASGVIGGKPILPDSVDVVWSLSRDADVLDSGGFESWAISDMMPTPASQSRSIKPALRSR